MATLVLKKWRLTKVATTTEAMQIEIVGRSSGFISWLLTLCGIDPTTSLFASDEGITFKSTSLAGADRIYDRTRNADYFLEHEHSRARQ